MPFAIGKYAWRRNEAVLRSNALILKDSIAALLFRVPGDLRTKACLGLKEFIAVHYDSLLYWNKDKHITFANDKIKYGHIKLVYKDQNNDIKVTQIGTCNKSSVDILELMKRSLIKTDNNLNKKDSLYDELAGREFKRTCMCLIPGQEPCTRFRFDHKERRMATWGHI